jgi:hypothetical protein
MIESQTQPKEKWVEIKSSVRCFQLADEPELIHVIKTGFRDHYMVVHEDAYEVCIGKVEFHNSVTLKEKYGISIEP